MSVPSFSAVSGAASCHVGDSRSMRSGAGLSPAESWQETDVPVLTVHKELDAASSHMTLEADLSPPEL